MNLLELSAEVMKALHKCNELGIDHRDVQVVLNAHEAGRNDASEAGLEESDGGDYLEHVRVGGKREPWFEIFTDRS